MSEFYIEQLIKVKNRINIYGATLLSIAVLISLIGLILGVNLTVVGMLLLVAGMLLTFKSSIEYEYLFLNREVDIDVIIRKKKRKKVYSFDMNDVVVVARADAGEVKLYQTIKSKDFSSNLNQDKVYKVVLSHMGKMEGVLIEPNSELLEAMKSVAPRKVFISDDKLS